MSSTLREGTGQPADARRAADAKRLDLPLRVAGLVMDSIVDGPGLRLSVFTQGCLHACPGCHNPQSHDPMGGEWITIRAILQKIQKNPLLSGVTLTGGEPLVQAEACGALIASLPPGLNVWLYSGYTLEEILQEGTDAQRALLHGVDVLVDGRYIAKDRSLSLPFRGSRNQRIIDMRQTIAQERLVLLDM